ncbi:unnamed protein product [Urochloa decumbens]|uniref:Receptor kinase-like protein Xa21 n=1 Tax=Urochloa decumbens TaxID=240449 RepID=A0ABC8YXU7_9POAL
MLQPPPLLLLLSSMSISTLAVAEADDEATLLAFKGASVLSVSGSHGDTLASWNRSAGGGRFCSWQGVTCGRRHRRVVALSLPSHGLTGALSPDISNLSYLRFLNLSYNGFRGQIPVSLGRLRRLQVIDLSHNAFNGELPANLSSCTNLAVMRLRFNQLDGPVPPELGDKLTSLMRLDLRNNSLTGAIPASLANLSLLNLLDLSVNDLEGSIPPGIGGIVGLQFLDLAYNNLVGDVPVSLYNLSLLGALQIQGNMLNGVIPADIGTKFPTVRILGLGRNQLIGSIPASLSNLTMLEQLELSNSDFTGYVPHTMGRLQALQGLYMWNNHLQADNREGWEFMASLSNCSQLQHLLLSGNTAFTGQMPSSIVNLSTTVQVLILDNTGISGSIPAAIGNLVNLQLLSLYNTSLSGVIPDSIGNLANLVQLDIYNTHLSGLIPPSIGNLSKLAELYAYNANLEGSIPASLGKLGNLLALDLSTNHLNGSIPKEIFRLPVISIYLNLSHNALTGPIPSEVSSFGNLNNLVLSGNQLSGTIPETIGECTVLQRLWLDDNCFEGSIPQSLKEIKGLSELKLSMNRLSGTIPDTIGSIRNLQQLVLAHNNLSGLIPMALQNLTSLSELDLSFNNLQAPCHTNSVKKKRKRWLRPLTIALSAIGAVLFLAFIIIFIPLNYKKCKQKQMSQFQQPMLEEQYTRLSYNALANGTNGFSEENLLGKGSFGEVYKCTLNDKGTIVAIKVFNLEKSGSARSFVAESETLRRVRHRYLVKIITCCSSINNLGEEFKALVFEFMPNGSLNNWLHPEFGIPNLRNTLSLEQRLDIVVNVMDALDYLHNQCQPSIIHCDLKPSNILLAEDMSARVGDFGISRILQERASKTLQNSDSTIGIRGSVGYVAPEYGEGSSVSTLGDVYSLGILLLEIFTGRSPTDDMFQGSLDLHKFSVDALPEKIWEIADATMWLHTDAYDSTARSRIQSCLVSVIALGISCSKKQPKERTPIQDAAIEMHAIRDSYLMLAQFNQDGDQSIVVRH